MKKFISPTVVLFLLAPVIGELLSGSSPPVEFFQPFSLLTLCALYGSGATLVRELALRWNKRWPSIFALGLAYGIIEEGLMVKSFFDPQWMDIGILGSYGRWAGVNWVWSVGLSIFHMLFSISIPILLTELLFPSQRESRWLGKRGMIFVSILLTLDVIFGFLVLTPYRPPLVPYLGAALAVFLLGWIARRMPMRWGLPQAGNISKPWRFELIGFIATLAFFFVLWGMPNLKVPVFITLTALILVPLATLGLTRSMSKQGNWTVKHQLAQAWGALLFFVLLAPLQELDHTRPDNTVGMSLVGLGFFLFLVFLYLKTRNAT
jgi:predicted Abi (CAAX) family protease